MNPSTFPRLILAEIAAVQRFIVLLGQEQEALQEGKLDRMEKLIEEKGALVNELTAIGEQRHDFLRQLGVSESTAGVEAWLLGQQNPKLMQAWKHLQSLAREAKSLNELNGQCIALLSRNNRQLLDAITGQQVRGTLYGPDGQTSISSGYRISDSV